MLPLYVPVVVWYPLYDAAIISIAPANAANAADAYTTMMAWGNSLESSVDQEYEAWLEYLEGKKIERLEARNIRRTARETRRNRRQQQALNARWAHKKAVLQRRNDQLNQERVFVAGAGVDGRYGTTVKHLGDSI